MHQIPENTRTFRADEIEVDMEPRTPCCGATLTGTEDGPACRSCYELYPGGIDW